MIAAQISRNAITSLICSHDQLDAATDRIKHLSLLKNCGSIVKKGEYYYWDHEADCKGGHHTDIGESLR